MSIFKSMSKLKMNKYNLCFIFGIGILGFIFGMLLQAKNCFSLSQAADLQSKIKFDADMFAQKLYFQQQTGERLQHVNRAAPVDSFIYAFVSFFATWLSLISSVN